MKRGRNGVKGEIYVWLGNDGCFEVPRCIPLESTKEIKKLTHKQTLEFTIKNKEIKNFLWNFNLRFFIYFTMFYTYYMPTVKQ